MIAVTVKVNAQPLREPLAEVAACPECRALQAACDVHNPRVPPAARRAVGNALALAAMARRVLTDGAE